MVDAVASLLDPPAGGSSPLHGLVKVGSAGSAALSTHFSYLAILKSVFAVNNFTPERTQAECMEA